MKELRREVVDVGNRVRSVEDTLDTRGQELEVLRKEVCMLNDQLLDLQMHAEDNENRSRRSNVCIRDAPPGAEGSHLVEYVTDLLRQLLDVDGSYVVKLDRAHLTNPINHN